MAGRTPQEAYRRFLEPLRAAIGCVAHANFTLEHGQTPRVLSVDTSYALALNDMALVTLRSTMPIAMALGLRIRILETDDTNRRFTVNTTQYSYTLATSDSEEILVFHWNPAATGGAAV